MKSFELVLATPFTRYFQTAPDQIWVNSDDKANDNNDDDDTYYKANDNDNADNDDDGDDNDDDYGDYGDDGDGSYFCGGTLLFSSETLPADPSFSDLVRIIIL